MDLLLQQTPPLDDLLLLFRHPLATAAAGVAWWLTVLAAAVGFWHLRSYKSTNVPVTSTTETVCRSPPPPPSVDLPASPTTSCLGTPKARFTSYYSFDDGDNDMMAEFEKEVEVEEEEEEEEVVVFSGEAIAAWEEEVGGVVVYSRSWDLGWYRCQKRAAINGSVVKYWAAAGDEATSPRGMSFRIARG